MNDNSFNTTRYVADTQHEADRENFGTIYRSMEFLNDLCGEKTFLTILYTERKRTERSGKPFLLTLIDTHTIMSAPFYPEILNDIKSVLLKSKRETDICGWYEYEARIGMIFTDIDSIETQEAREAISSKIRRNLSESIPPEIMDELLVDFHFYPEEHDDNSATINLFEKILYPDIHLDNQTKRYGYFFKRVIDIIASSLAILLLSPVFCLISLLIIGHIERTGAVSAGKARAIRQKIHLSEIQINARQ